MATVSNRQLGLLFLGLVGTALLLSVLSSTVGGASPTGGFFMGYRGGAGFMAPSAGSPLTIDQALQVAGAAVAQAGNPDLHVSEMMEFQNNFYAIVSERSTGKGAWEMLVDRFSGVAFPEPGPNMMWNTNFGHTAGRMMGPPSMSGGMLMGGGMLGGPMMSGAGPGMMGPGMIGGGGMMGPGMMGGPGTGMMGSGMTTAMMLAMMSGPTSATVAPTVTSQRASEVAQRWLEQNQPGSTLEAPDEFPGYYTIHILKDGPVMGMLSVNAYTGQVWYHAWHGAFIQERAVTP